MSKKNGACSNIAIGFRLYSRRPCRSLCRSEFTSDYRWKYLSDIFFYRSDRTHLVYHMLVPSAFTCLLILTTASTLGYNRYETHYGQDQSRLSRDCAILSDDSTEVQWTRRLLSLLSFRTSDRYLETLDALFVDKFVYAHVWNTFMTTCLKTWRRDCCTSAMFLLFVHLFTQLIPLSWYPDFNSPDCIFYASSILYRQY